MTQIVHYIAPQDDPRTLIIIEACKDALISVDRLPRRLRSDDRVSTHDPLILFCGPRLDEPQFSAGISHLREAIGRGYRGPVAALATEPSSVSEVQEWVLQFQGLIEFLGTPQSGYIEHHNRILGALGITGPVAPPPNPQNVADYLLLMMRDLSARALTDEDRPEPLVPPPDGRLCATVRDATLAQIAYGHRIMQLTMSESRITSTLHKIVYYADKKYRGYLQQITAQARLVHVSERQVLTAFCEAQNQISSRPYSTKTTDPVLHIASDSAHPERLGWAATMPILD